MVFHGCCIFREKEEEEGHWFSALCVHVHTGDAEDLAEPVCTQVACLLQESHAERAVNLESLYL